MACLFATGFEHNVASSQTGGIWTGGTGTARSIVNTPTRSGSGSYVLRINPSAATAVLEKSFTASAVVAVSFYVRFATFPGSTTTIARLSLTTGASPRVRFNATTSKLEIQFGPSGTPVAASSTVTTNTWYRIDLKIDCSANPNSINWSLDGTSQTQCTSAQAADTVIAVRLGVEDVSVTADIYYEDLVVTNSGSDYPLGEYKIFGLRPNADGTHNAGTNIMEDGAGADINGTSVTAWNLLDETDWTSVADRVRQLSNGTGNYAEVNFENLPASPGTPTFVFGLVHYTSATTAANNGSTIAIVDGVEAEVHGTSTTPVDMSETTSQYRTKLITAPAGGWTTTIVDALKMRIGYSSDASPDPYWQALMFEVACKAVTAVGNTVTVDWHVKAALGDTQAMDWHVKAAVGDTQTTDWNVRTSVYDTQAMDWHVKAAVGDIQAIDWNVKATVGDTQTTDWNVLSSVSAVGDEVALDWHVKAAVGDIQAIDWNVRTNVYDTQAADWHVKAAVGDIRAIDWNVRTSVYDTQAADWHVKASVGDIQAIDWNVKTAIGDIRAIDWNVRTSVYDTQAADWHVKAAVGDIRAIDWNVLSLAGAVYDEITLGWHIKQAVSDTQEIAHHIKAMVGDDLGLDWHIKVIAGDEQTIDWNILANVSTVWNEITLSWHIRQAIGNDQAIAWLIKQTLGSAATMRWHVLNRNLKAIAASALVHLATLRTTVRQDVEVSASVTQTGEVSSKRDEALAVTSAKTQATSSVED